MTYPRILNTGRSYPIRKNYAIFKVGGFIRSFLNEPKIQPFLFNSMCQSRTPSAARAGSRDNNWNDTPNRRPTMECKWPLEPYGWGHPAASTPKSWYWPDWLQSWRNARAAWQRPQQKRVFPHKEKNFEKFCTGLQTHVIQNLLFIKRDNVEVMLVERQHKRLLERNFI